MLSTFMWGINTNLHILYVSFIYSYVELLSLVSSICMLATLARIQKSVAYSLTSILSLILRGCLKYSLHSSGEVSSLCYIHLLSTFIRGNILFIFLYPEISSIFTIQLVITFLNSYFFLSFYFYHS